MTSYSNICQRLPSLYRPHESDSDLFTRFLNAVAAIIDEADREASSVMQSHWFSYADDPRFDLYFNLAQALAYPDGASDIELRQAQLNFSYIHDLAAIAALFQLPPWKDAVNSGETVSHYRKRLSEIIGVYRGGLGSLSSLQKIIAAELPDDSVEGSSRELAFVLQEFVSSAATRQSISARGFPSNKLGPLMRWKLQNLGLLPAIPTIYIAGVAEDKQTDATERPVIELFSAGNVSQGRVGIAYDGNLSDGQVLRIAPRYHSWLATAAGLRRADSQSDQPLPDISAAGPWQDVAGAPAGAATHLTQVRDQTLWVVVGNTLHAFDGIAWQVRLSGLPVVHCLVEYQESLWLGTADGLLQLPMYPIDGVFTPQPAIADLAGPAVYGLFRSRTGSWWAATAKGIKLWDGSGFTDIQIGATAETQIPVYGIYEDNSATLSFACERGVIQYQPAFDHWYLFVGGEFSDTEPDWVRLKAGETWLSVDKIFLPPVNAVLRSRDAGLWLATIAGIACYRATPVRNFSYRTHLTAFPQLNTGNVTRIYQDSLGALWFCCDRGLLRFDGKHWYQLQGDELVRLPAADESLADTRAWRYLRGSAQWQFYDEDRKSWLNAAEGTLLDTTQNAVHAILWTSSALAGLGQWQDGNFVTDSAASPAALKMRYKPAADGDRRIVDGGIPGLPAMPPGDSVWRYLRLEQSGAEASANRPSWTCEGRLLPPPDDAEDIEEGRFSSLQLALSEFDEAVFAYKPAAQVWFSWQTHQPLTLQARLFNSGDQVDPNVLNRVWDGIQQVRPAGLKAELVVNNQIVRGDSNG